MLPPLAARWAAGTEPIQQWSVPGLGATKPGAKTSRMVPLAWVDQQTRPPRLSTATVGPSLSPTTGSPRRASAISRGARRDPALPLRKRSELEPDATSAGASRIQRASPSRPPGLAERSMAVRCRRSGTRPVCAGGCRLPTARSRWSHLLDPLGARSPQVRSHFLWDYFPSYVKFGIDEPKRPEASRAPHERRAPGHRERDR